MVPLDAAALIQRNTGGLDLAGDWPAGGNIIRDLFPVDPGFYVDPPGSAGFLDLGTVLGTAKKVAEQGAGAVIGEEVQTQTDAIIAQLAAKAPTKGQTFAAYAAAAFIFGIFAAAGAALTGVALKHAGASIAKAWPT